MLSYFLDKVKYIMLLYFLEITKISLGNSSKTGVGSEGAGKTWIRERDNLTHFIYSHNRFYRSRIMGKGEGHLGWPNTGLGAPIVMPLKGNRVWCNPQF